LQVRAHVDGIMHSNATTADVHRKTAGDHGLVMNLYCSLFASGKHKITVDAHYEGNWVELDTAFCTGGNKATKCPVERRLLPVCPYVCSHKGQQGHQGQQVVPALCTSGATRRLRRPRNTKCLVERRPGVARIVVMRGWSSTLNDWRRCALLRIEEEGSREMVAADFPPWSLKEPQLSTPLSRYPAHMCLPYLHCATSHQMEKARRCWPRTQVKGLVCMEQQIQAAVKRRQAQ
jgi:hypothetical protein